MERELTVIAIGDELGVILPHEILERLGAEKDDSLYYHQTERGIEITSFDTEFDKQMAIAKRIMHEDREVLKKLADS